MGWAIKQLAPSLRGIGVEVELDRTSDKARTRCISLMKVAERTSETSETSDACPDDPQEPDSDGRSSDVSTAGADEKRPALNCPDAPVAAPSDVSDVSDVSPATTNTGGASSEEAGEWEY